MHLFLLRMNQVVDLDSPKVFAIALMFILLFPVVMISLDLIWIVIN